MGCALMGAPLRDGLLFCFFSLLFGGGAVLYTELLKRIFTAFFLLPRGKGEKISFRFAVGFFFYDLFLCTSLSSAYMIFLYLANEGVFRVYSLLLCVLGFLLFMPFARTFSRPFGFLLSEIALCVTFPLRRLVQIFRRLVRKKRKRLDEKGEMV